MKAATLATACCAAFAGLAFTTSSLAQTRPPHTPGADRFAPPDPIEFAKDTPGFRSLFDGKTLDGWSGDARYWHVEKGAIVGESSAENPVSNAYLIYTKLKARDFDLKFEIKVEKGGGSGFQYRSFTGRSWEAPRVAGDLPADPQKMLSGPQADFWYPVSPITEAFSGQFYTENSDLGIVAFRGQVTQLEPGARKRLLGEIADSKALGGYVRINDWNEYEVIARGGVMMHILNGRLMAVLVDDDPKSDNQQAGLFGLELEQFPSKVSFRNIRVKLKE